MKTYYFILHTFLLVLTLARLKTKPIYKRCATLTNDRWGGAELKGQILFCKFNIKSKADLVSFVVTFPNLNIWIYLRAFEARHRNILGPIT